MTELEEIFNELGISHYLHDFLEQGFDTWETILDITESDFDALGVKLGHRRKLQRKIANSRGLSSDRALHSPRGTPTDDQQIEEQRLDSAKPESRDGGSSTQGAKRKYRRRPKPDENAPERPPSAYVIFSNKMRDDLKGRNLSFTEIAKLVGENWQSLSPLEKEPYEQQAFMAKERYSSELAEYKKTDHFREYSAYLAEFKARQSNTQQASHAEPSKRPKLDGQSSATRSGVGSSWTASSGTVSSGTMSSIASIQQEQSSSILDRRVPTDARQSPEMVADPKTIPASAPIHSRASPTTTSSTVLPGYRDSIYAGSSAQHQNLAWRDNERDEWATMHLPRLSSVDDRQPHLTGPLASDPLSVNSSTASLPHDRRTGYGRAPPLLTSESTNTSSSTISSAYYSPRTPMDSLLLDRSLALSGSYNTNPLSSLEKQLPPLRPPSLSPQTSSLGAQQSPNGVHTFADFVTTIPPIRSLIGSNPPKVHHDHGDVRMRGYMSDGVSEDDNLDPVSALIKAGEIVNRNSQHRSGAQG